MMTTKTMLDQSSGGDQSRLETPMPPDEDHDDAPEEPPPYTPDEGPPAPVKEPGRPEPDVEDPEPRRPQRTRGWRTGNSLQRTSQHTRKEVDDDE